MDLIAVDGKMSVHLHEPGKNVLVVAVKDNSIGTDPILYENALIRAIKEAIGGDGG